ncbi:MULTISPECIES: hypothetical protein [Streptomyces]|uniref:Secreted protein n=1 Tax=Streptomyces glycanivorans TaxID=3033808 RepID=A0ABY9JGD9_9ACTN|nr:MULTISPECIES: hypothetical protein [unclassified Streptomyces]WSQ78449.1 hypothetical protein OG725_15585 [Streptomyces sp. NBC_01213]TXS16836.1 hypothetical protein EAO68_02725 [Streptomyces sp. wa22]WLQ65071.1 hypothetical protein P8A20_16335 [Streptomyces sp. Alt3]WSQ85847.1 hypothetical protein OG722_16380 [Streptomyces sp. NBC_01212]WSR08081.1 hypothetical protein OG265_19730 [Streptomyces sp. NBC_01208]
MSDGLPLLALAVVLAAVMGFFRWLASRVRRRGTAGSAVSAALASYDEAFRVTAHDAHHEIRAQAERKAPLLSPDRLWKSGREVGPTSWEHRRPGPRSRIRRLWRGRRPGAE